MILVDTSVWIDHFRKRNSRLNARRLAGCGIGYVDLHLLHRREWIARHSGPSTNPWRIAASLGLDA